MPCWGYCWLWSHTVSSLYDGNATHGAYALPILLSYQHGHNYKWFGDQYECPLWQALRLSDGETNPHLLSSVPHATTTPRPCCDCLRSCVYDSRISVLFFCIASALDGSLGRKSVLQNCVSKWTLYFYGDSVNAIESQNWVTMIANLLLTVIHKRLERKWAFSNMVTMIR